MLMISEYRTINTNVSYCFILYLLGEFMFLLTLRQYSEADIKLSDSDHFPYFCFIFVFVI